MRAFAFALTASLALASAAEAAPRRVASLNLCTDELLLTLGLPEQIASVTHLSQQMAETPLWSRAQAYPRNDGSLVSVAGIRPDLVLTMGGGARDRSGIAAKLGIPVLNLPFPQNLEDIRRAVITVAAALGRQRIGETVAASLQALNDTAPKAGVDTIWLGGGGRSVAAESLPAEWMRLAGLRQRALIGDRVSLEQLLVRPPAIILRSNYRSGQYSSEQRWLTHPLAAHVRARRVVVTDGRLWTCMGPLMIREIERLRREVRR